jgi:sterol 3beta-glucosyltransferase
VSGRKFTILALGSRGDVQPFVALGKGLVAAGHSVRIAAAEDYGPLVTEHCLPFHPLVGRIADLMDRELVYAAFDAGANPLPFARRFRDAVTPLMECLLHDCLAAARGADTLIVSTLGVYPGESVAEALGSLPVIEAHFHPVAATRTLPHAFFPELRLSAPLTGIYNRLSHILGAQGMHAFLRPALNRARRSVGLRPAPLMPPSSPRLSLHGYSPSISPPPSDWDKERVNVTGYWPLPSPPYFRLPLDLERFLDGGLPPVYIGFGSILAGRDPNGVTHLLADALDRAGVRGILYRGWGDLGNVPLPPTVYLTDGVPHDILFPRMAAVVHHGGAGTTAATLRAGVPSIAVPFFGDQRFWARRLHELGASPLPIPRDALTAERLAEGIRAVLASASFRDRAETLGHSLAAEEGIVNAIAAIEVHLKDR